MAVEHARANALPKPWGVLDLRPWNNARHGDSAIGEIWYERSSKATVDPSLLIKLLFTSQPLSIQVHPSDSDAHSIGLPRGKSEAWYVLSATSEAKVAVGLKQHLTPQQLRDRIDDGSIANLVVWRPVARDDVISVPAGTIHAIGGGLVIAEIQQRSDATFRMFDHGRNRQLHVDSAVAVANTRWVDVPAQPKQLSNERTLLIANPHFVFERIKVAANSVWRLSAERETWMMILSGGACAGSFDVGIGDVIFAQSDSVAIHAGTAGMTALVAYTGNGPISHLLQDVEEPSAIDAERSTETPVSSARAAAVPVNTLPETIQ